MDLKKTLFPLALVASLAPRAAFADHDRYDRYGDDRREAHERWERRERWEHQRLPVWPTYGNPGDSGQRWIPAHSQQVWVPRQCMDRGHWLHREWCTGGFFENRWVPGHYESVW